MSVRFLQRQPSMESISSYSSSSSYFSPDSLSDAEYDLTSDEDEIGYGAQLRRTGAQAQVQVHVQGQPQAQLQPHNQPAPPYLRFDPPPYHLLDPYPRNNNNAPVNPPITDRPINNPLPNNPSSDPSITTSAATTTTTINNNTLPKPPSPPPHHPPPVAPLPPPPPLPPQQLTPNPQSQTPYDPPYESPRRNPLTYALLGFAAAYVAGSSSEERRRSRCRRYDDYDDYDCDYGYDGHGSYDYHERDRGRDRFDDWYDDDYGRDRYRKLEADEEGYYKVREDGPGVGLVSVFARRLGLVDRYWAWEIDPVGVVWRG